MSNAVEEFFRCPEGLVRLSSSQDLHPAAGYFQFGPGAVCYGRSILSPSTAANGDPCPDLFPRVTWEGSTLCLPFDAESILNNFWFEHYPSGGPGTRRTLASQSLRRVYYAAKPLLPDPLRRSLQRIYFRKWREIRFPQWPVDTSVELVLERILQLSLAGGKINRIPFIWFWPEGAPAAAIMTHDVETAVGLDFIPRLMDIDDAFDINASFQIVPERRYRVPADLLRAIRARHHEVNVHGLDHGGNLFQDRDTFLKQSSEINRYIRQFDAQGFRSPCMYRNLDWYEALDASYDMSVPNVAHFEPQRGGCCTVFPYFAGKTLELPLTTVQDYTLFHILRDYSIDLWKEQIGVIAARHGLISFIAHPDYMQGDRECAIYKALLDYLSQLRTERSIWITRPGEVNRWWRDRSQMRLVLEDGRWRIEGHGKERARVGYACIQDGRIAYSVEQTPEAC